MNELERLRAENRRLRELLTQDRIAIPTTARPEEVQDAEGALKLFSPEEKIHLLRRLFRGREDISTVRWESPDGRNGYSPKSERDWKAYHAARSEDRKRIDKEARKYRPLTNGVVQSHLRGRTILGVYPLLLDETCWFLAADSDMRAAIWRFQRKGQQLAE